MELRSTAGAGQDFFTNFVQINYFSLTLDHARLCVVSFLQYMFPYSPFLTKLENMNFEALRGDLSASEGISW